MTWADLDGDGQGELITGKRIWAHLEQDPGADEPGGDLPICMGPEKSIVPQTGD
jgi:hypothetical protein